MKNYSGLILLFTFFSFSLSAQAQQTAKTIADNYLNNRPPLISKPFIELPLGAISPDGWLKDQLIRQKNGMTGHLDEIYEAVMGKRNGWLGGDGDVWERGPYWIDGLLPLAYILKDKELIAKVKPWTAVAEEKPKEGKMVRPPVENLFPDAILPDDVLHHIILVIVYSVRIKCHTDFR